MMLLLLDIGNSNTHLGLANSRRVVKQANIATTDWNVHLGSICRHLAVGGIGFSF